MKKIAIAILAATSSGSLVSAAPFLAVGDGAELFVTGTLGIRADDNIYTVQNATSDTIFDINPGLELTFGKNSTVKGSLTLVESFSNYADNSKLNTNLFSGNFSANFDDEKLKLNFGVGFNETNQNTPTISGLTRRDSFNISAGGEYQVSELTSISASTGFTHDNFKVRGYADSDNLPVSLGFYYKWTPKVDLSVGYTYRSYETTIGRDSTDHFFNVGARGDFSPKLKGSFAVGINTREISGGGTETLPGLSSTFTYELTPKTNLEFGASNDFGTSPQGLQQKNFSLNGGVNIALDEQWSLRGSVSYRAINYYTRTDDYIDATVGASYSLNAYVKINGSYTYRNNSSKLAGGDFTQNVFSISTGFRY